MNLNYITLTEDRLLEIVESTAKYAAHQALIDAGLPVRDLLSATEMIRRFGSHNFRRCKNKLTPHKVDGGHTILYSASEYLTKCII